MTLHKILKEVPRPSLFYSSSSFCIFCFTFVRQKLFIYFSSSTGLFSKNKKFFKQTRFFISFYRTISNFSGGWRVGISFWGFEGHFFASLGENFGVIPSFGPRFVSECDRQSSDITQIISGYNFAVKPTTNQPSSSCLKKLRKILYFVVMSLTLSFFSLIFI